MPGFQEEINSNGHNLYWYEPNANKQADDIKILGMDLDWTLIRPIKGKIHPLDENDWQFLYDAKYMRAIYDKITAGYKLVIFTNQGGLLSNKKNGSGSKMDVEGFKNRWHIILERLEKEFNIKPLMLIASLYDDFNRKPCCGMWEFLEEMMMTTHGLKIDRSSSLYIGDMAGRKGDHLASDLLFAMNLDVEFQVPEVFYGIEGFELAGNKTASLIKNVLEDERVFNPKMVKIPKRISKINAATRDEIQAVLQDGHTQSLVIFVGSPASGKSSWYDINLKGLSKSGLELVHLGMDTFNGTLAKFYKEVEAELKKGKNVVVDNTNGSSKARGKLATLAKEVNKDIQVLVVHFTTEKRICLYQNALRTKKVNVCELRKQENCGHNVPAVAIHTYWKHFEEVDMNKELNIDVIYTITWEPVFKNEKDEKVKKMFLSL
jgi:bifunctional polynucleotide phosphatase/kinase